MVLTYLSLTVMSIIVKSLFFLSELILYLKHLLLVGANRPWTITYPASLVGGFKRELQMPPLPHLTPAVEGYDLFI